MRFTLKQFFVPNFSKKIAILSVSIFCMGLFVSLLLEAGWGSDPFTFMNESISQRLGISFGTWELILNASLIILTIIFAPELIGFGTLENMIFIGYIADFFRWVWKTTGIHDVIGFAANPPVWLHVLVFGLSIFLFIISAAVYMNARMGLSPYDSIPKIINKGCKKIPFTPLRMCYDASACIIGFIVSPYTIKDSQLYLPMIGAVIMVFFLGPVIGLVGRFMQNHIFKDDIETYSGEN
ncbi:hypothetical protein [Treponema sp.]|uniref:YczE/YyaS/YitT family protein n=1 Tax=Treponema sp. TaxID=166 RepID=UPI0025D1FF3D|nr:hypothetical protein [Treponema sp.]MCR5217465.1 hypothetical protein [Treponema sp.]